MKIIIMLISSLFLTANTCTKKVREVANNQTVTVETKETEVTGNNGTPIQETTSSQSEGTQTGTIDKQDSELVVEYEALSRGMFLKVKYANGLVNVFNDRDNSEKSTSVKLTKVQYDELNKLLGAIQPEKLETMQAPTQARLYDGAAHANMTITTKGKTYSCSGFDHGQPPADIEKFVKKLLSYAEKK